MMNDLVILNISVHLAASKNKSYQTNTYLCFEALIKFLQSNGLTTRDILKNNESTPKDFKLMKSDITDEGYELIKKSLDNWFRVVASGKKKVDDVSLLSRALEKMRTKHCGTR